MGQSLAQRLEASSDLILDRLDRDLESRRDLLVAQTVPPAKQHRLPPPRRQAAECLGDRCIEIGAVGGLTVRRLYVESPHLDHLPFTPPFLHPPALEMIEGLISD